MSHRYLTHDKNGDCVLKTPYDAKFIRMLKDLVDSDSRRWDPDARHWIVDGAYESKLDDLLHDCFGRGAKAKPSAKRTHTSRVRDDDRPIENVEEDDPVMALASARDPIETIRDLTSRLGALTYELEMERQEIKALRDEENRLGAANRKLERENRELNYELALAKAKSAIPGEMPHRGGRPMNGPHAILHVAPDAPNEVIQAAYKALAMKYHPDRGGDTETMARINDAMDKIGRSAQ